RMPDRRELEEAADHREERERADRPAHRESALLAVMRVEMLPREGRRLSGEDDEVEAEGVDAREECPDEPQARQQDPVPAAVEAGGEDRVLREEAGERRDADESERADQEDEPRERH